MGERKKIGVRVDDDVWQEFVNHVESEKGQKRGVLGDELENAIRNYIHFGTDKTLPEVMAEFNERLYRVEDAMGTVPSDGGAPTFGVQSHTHAPTKQTTDAPTEKPAANAATEKKVQWLESEVLDMEVPQSRGLQQVARAGIVELVKDRYGFRSDTAKRYVGELVEHFGLRPHPKAGDSVLVTDKQYNRIIETTEEDQ